MPKLSVDAKIVGGWKNEETKGSFGVKSKLKRPITYQNQSIIPNHLGFQSLTLDLRRRAVSSILPKCSKRHCLITLPSSPAYLLITLIIGSHIAIWTSNMPRDIGLKLTLINAAGWAVVFLPAWGVSKWAALHKDRDHD